jgi:hypothetical protein
MSDDLVTRQEDGDIVVCNPETGEEWLKSDESADLTENQ